MKKNKVGLGLVGLLAVTLVVGMIYILLQPDSDTRAEASQNQGTGYRGGQTETNVLTETTLGGAGYRGGQTVIKHNAQGTEAITPLNGRGNAQVGTQGLADGSGGGYRGGQGVSGADAGQGYNPTTPAIAAEDWETVTGTVLVSDSELTIETASGEILVGLGQATYRDAAQFVINVGDQVKVQGYYEDGEFKAGTVENLTTGQSLTLRDATGRPMWAGQGRRAQSQ